MWVHIGDILIDYIRRSCDLPKKEILMDSNEQSDLLNKGKDVVNWKFIMVYICNFGCLRPCFQKRKFNRSCDLPKEEECSCSVTDHNWVV